MPEDASFFHRPLGNVSPMYQPWEKVRDLATGAERLRRRRYGVIEVADDQFVAVHLRPWPKTVSVCGARWLGARQHRQRPGNHCWLYYNHPLSAPGFLALTYVVSARETTLLSFRGALTVLDEIARLKGSVAIVCEASNLRISDRLLRRWGWEQHLRSARGRHFIKRFWGEYPPLEWADSIRRSAFPSECATTDPSVAKPQRVAGQPVEC